MLRDIQTEKHFPVFRDFSSMAIRHSLAEVVIKNAPERLSMAV